jgi:hypothetical protein
VTPVCSCRNSYSRLSRQSSVIARASQLPKQPLHPCFVRARLSAIVGLTLAWRTLLSLLALIRRSGCLHAVSELFACNSRVTLARVCLSGASLTVAETTARSSLPHAQSQASTATVPALLSTSYTTTAEAVEACVANSARSPQQPAVATLRQRPRSTTEAVSPTPD